MKRFLLALALLLPLPALAQSPEQFNAFVGGLAAATTVNPTDYVYILQGGVSKRAPVNQIQTISSVANVDGTVTVSPTIGNVVVSLNLSNSNIWNVPQTIPTIYGGNLNSSTLTLGSTSGAGTADLIQLQTGSQISHILIDSIGWSYIGNFNASGRQPNTAVLGGASNGLVAVGRNYGGNAEIDFLNTNYTNATTVSFAFYQMLTATTSKLLFSGGLGAAFAVNGALGLNGATSGTTTLNASAAASGAATFPANTGTVAELNLAQTWTALQSHASGAFALNGSTSGATTVNAPASGGGTATFFAGSDTVAGKLLANGGTNASLTASNGGIVYSSAAALAILAGTATSGQCLLSGASAAPSWQPCPGGGVTSVSNTDGTLSVTPITGAAVASLNLANPNTWTAAQSFNSGTLKINGATSGATTVNASATGGGTATFFSGTDTIAGRALNHGGTNATLTASNGGIVYSTAAAMAILAGTATSGQCLLSGASAAPSWQPCPGGVSSVSAGDGSLNISPTTGAVVATLNVGNSNTWTANQVISADLQAQTFRAEADLRQFGSLSCNPGAPTSSGVAQAAVNAYNAGYRHFFIPSGCFIYVGDSPWVSAFGTNQVPGGTGWRGEEWNTSGMSVCASYTSCAPSGTASIGSSGTSQITWDNMFGMDGGCYNVDGSSFGHPARCPWHHIMIGGGSFSLGPNYPGGGIGLNIGALTNGTWNGTDTPGFAINNETSGDDIFLQSASASINGNFLNLFNGSGMVVQIHFAGDSTFGNSSTSHRAMMTVADAYGSCGWWTNPSGQASFPCSSDERLKSDISDDQHEPDALPYIKSFHIRDFTLKVSGQRFTGVIAQELRTNHPEMIVEGKDGYLQAFGPSEWTMVRAMQQMQGEIEDLQARVH